MKTKVLLTMTMLLCILTALGQKLSIDLTFSAINNTAHVQLDSIKVVNRSNGDESILYYPDTTLSIDITPGDLLLYIGYSTGFPVGVKEIRPENPSFQLFQSFPNPVKDQSKILMCLPEDGRVSIMVNDSRGTVIVSEDRLMEKGLNSFRFSPGNSSIYFLSVRWKGLIKTIKILNTEQETGKTCMLEYVGTMTNNHAWQAQLIKNDLDMQESGILDAPAANKTYTFEFATNIPCPGTPTVVYEGQTYNTIQIFSQCWLKENLNVGTMIPGTIEPSPNNTIEKYCYNNEPDSCTKYGGLYEWQEMMQYTTQQGTQGICPAGWHIPTDEEWKVTEGAVDSQYGIGDIIWDSYGYRGFDAGINLKTMSGWNGIDNGSDLFGFSGLPSGVAGFGNFGNVGDIGYWWSSTDNSYFKWARLLDYSDQEAIRFDWDERNGLSVRCIRDN